MEHDIMYWKNKRLAGFFLGDSLLGLTIICVGIILLFGNFVFLSQKEKQGYQNLERNKQLLNQVRKDTYREQINNHGTIYIDEKVQLNW